MKIPTNYDVVNKGAIPASKGTDYCDNPGIMPNEKPIADTPGERATNEESAYSVKKGQPFGKGGSGYTDRD